MMRGAPSAAGFHTAELFFTDDSGTYMFPTRDAGALIDPADEDVTVEKMLERHESLIVKLDDRRIEFPREEPYYEGHNTWCVNVPGSLLALAIWRLPEPTRGGSDAHASTVEPAPTVTDDVGERVRAVEVMGRCVRDLAAGADHGRTVSGRRHISDTEDAALGVEVVGKDLDGAGGLFRGGHGVVGRQRRHGH